MLTLILLAIIVPVVTSMCVKTKQILDFRTFISIQWKKNSNNIAIENYVLYLKH